MYLPGAFSLLSATALFITLTTSAYLPRQTNPNSAYLEAIGVDNQALDFTPVNATDPNFKDVNYSYDIGDVWKLTLFIPAEDATLGIPNQINMVCQVTMKGDKQVYSVSGYNFTEFDVAKKMEAIKSCELPGANVTQS